MKILRAGYYLYLPEDLQEMYAVRNKIKTANYAQFMRIVYIKCILKQYS